MVGAVLRSGHFDVFSGNLRKPEIPLDTVKQFIVIDGPLEIVIDSKLEGGDRMCFRALAVDQYERYRFVGSAYPSGEL